MKERVHKLLAEANIGSRRESELLIEQGRVRVNGAIITVGDKADKDTDTIEVDGQKVNFGRSRKRYIALYKPKQVLSTHEPHQGDDRQTVFDLVPVKERLFSIGRLDADSEGLIVLTNDGEMAQRLSHPRFKHTKTYKVQVVGLPSERALERWQSGVELEDGMTAPCIVRIVKGDPRETTLRIIMTEGKKRQIRRIGSLLGHPVRRLVRTHIGMLSVEGLRPGEWREMNAADVEALQTPSHEIKLLRSASRQQYNRDRDTPREPRPAQRESAPPRRSGYVGTRPASQSGEPAGWRKKADDVIDSWSPDRRPRREGDSRPPRRDGDSRPPRREGGSSDRPQFRREGDSRPPRRDGDARPPRREGGSSDRPQFRRDGDARPPRREGGASSDRPPRRDGDSRPPRRSGDRPGGQYRPTNRPTQQRPRKPDDEE
jgi:23S rRNA pseudouridine2605 synthase